MACGEENINFLQAYRINPSIPCVSERYFKTRLIPERDQCVLVHSNRLCLITIAPTHPLLQGKKQIESINFETARKKNRLNNKVSGKFKRGGQKLQENSVICIVKTVDGLEYTMYSCMTGTLIEANERLLKDPNILISKPYSDGYIAIILPPFPSNEKTVTKDIVN